MSTSSEKDVKRDFGQDPEFQAPQSHADETIAHDAVFGEITDKGPNYRNVSTPIPEGETLEFFQKAS